MPSELDRFISDLRAVASRSGTIAAQMCGEAAALIEKISNKSEAIEEIRQLRATIRELEAPKQEKTIGPGTLWYSFDTGMISSEALEKAQKPYPPQTPKKSSRF